jgi:hypothetical protein
VIEVPLRRISKNVKMQVKLNVERKIQAALSEAGYKYDSNLVFSGKHEYFYAFDVEGVNVIGKIHEGKKTFSLLKCKNFN